MAAKKTSKNSAKEAGGSREKKRNLLSATTYKNCKIEIIEGDVTPVLEVDGKKVSIGRDADTGSYTTSHAPYVRFATLEEVGKAVVDSEND